MSYQMLFESLTSDGNFKISVAQSRIKGLYSASITRNAPRSYGANPSNLDLIWSKFELGATPVQALRNVFREHYLWMQWQHGIIENPYKMGIPKCPDCDTGMLTEEIRQIEGDTLYETWCPDCELSYTWWDSQTFEEE